MGGRRSLEDRLIEQSLPGRPRFGHPVPEVLLPAWAQSYDPTVDLDGLHSLLASTEPPLNEAENISNMTAVAS